MYLYDLAKNPIDRAYNKETLQRAEQIRQKRENHINKPEIYTGYEKEQLKIKEQGEKNFVAYFKALADKKETKISGSWSSSYKYFEKFTNGNLKFADLNETLCNDFKEYLLTTKSLKNTKKGLEQNTASTYFNKLKTTLKQAYIDGYINADLNARIKCIENKETIPQTLTIEELNVLVKCECKYPLLKKVVLFFALTGVPFKEMQNLEWKEIEISETFGIRIKMIRSKTGKPYLVNISEQAYSLLGERRNPTDKVFEGLSDEERYRQFPLWLAQAGITKEMTFHDLRHTYGCLQVDAGTDIYTLQGNMGHSTPRQTMAYGKISDQRKREAADRIKLDM